MEIEVNSGACEGRKGDLKGKEILIETKTPERPQERFTLQEKWFKKLMEQAFSMGKAYHALVFTFNQIDQYAALPLVDLMNLYHTVIDQQDLLTRLGSELSNMCDLTTNQRELITRLEEELDRRKMSDENTP